MPVGPFAAKHIYEITWLEKLVLSAPCIVRTQRLGEVQVDRDRLPVHGLVVGPDAAPPPPLAPEPDPDEVQAPVASGPVKFMLRAVRNHRRWAR